jgi:hypothetical protein
MLGLNITNSLKLKPLTAASCKQEIDNVRAQFNLYSNMSTMDLITVNLFLKCSTNPIMGLIRKFTRKSVQYYVLTLYTLI